MAKRAATTATTSAQAEPTEHSAIGDDRLVGNEAIGRLIDSRMNARMALHLLETGLYLCWRNAGCNTISCHAISTLLFSARRFESDLY
jgi:hypothetical protein